MKVILILLLRLAFFYLLFRFISTVITLAMRYFVQAGHRRRREEKVTERSSRQTKKDAPRYENVIDAEFEEIK